MAYRENKTRDEEIRQRLIQILKEKDRERSYTGSAFAGGASRYADRTFTDEFGNEFNQADIAKRWKGPKKARKKAPTKPRKRAPAKAKAKAKGAKKKAKGYNPWRVYFVKQKKKYPKKSMKAIAREYNRR